MASFIKADLRIKYHLTHTQNISSLFFFKFVVATIKCIEIPLDLFFGTEWVAVTLLLFFINFMYIPCVYYIIKQTKTFPVNVFTSPLFFSKSLNEQYQTELQQFFFYFWLLIAHFFAFKFLSFKSNNMSAVNMHIHYIFLKSLTHLFPLINNLCDVPIKKILFIDFTNEMQ